MRDGGGSTERELWGAEKREKEEKGISGLPITERLENSIPRN